jgi:FkbM family methyltransferase
MKFQVGSVTVDLIDEGDRICLGVVAKAKPFEPRTLEVFGELCAKAGDGFVIDVGAYTGLFSIAAAKMGCKVIGVEPLPQNFARLVENAERNDALRPGVNFINAACADFDGDGSIAFNPRVSFTSGASLKNQKLVKTKRYGAIQTRVLTLDGWDWNDVPVAVIKIDVERAEPDVLRGARGLLARCKPALIVEVLGDDEKAAVLAAATGYRVAEQMDGRNLLLLPA